MRASYRRFVVGGKFCPCGSHQKNRLRSCPGFAPAPQQPLKAEGLNGAVIHRADVPRQRGLKRRPLGTLLSPPDAVRPRDCLSLELWPKAWLPLERAVRGITPDTPDQRGRAALQIPAQGTLPLDAAMDSPSGLTRFH